MKTRVALTILGVIAVVQYVRSQTAICYALLYAFLATISTPPDPRLDLITINLTNDTLDITYAANVTCQMCTYNCLFERICPNFTSSNQPQDKKTNVKDVPYWMNVEETLFPPTLFNNTCLRQSCAPLPDCVLPDPCDPDTFDCPDRRPLCCLDQTKECLQGCMKDCKTEKLTCVKRCATRGVECII